MSSEALETGYHVLREHLIPFNDSLFEFQSLAVRVDGGATEPQMVVWLVHLVTESARD